MPFVALHDFSRPNQVRSTHYNTNITQIFFAENQTLSSSEYVEQVWEEIRGQSSSRDSFHSGHRAIAKRLGLEGASVVISSRRKNNVDEAVEKLRSEGIEVMGVACHVSDAQQRKNLIQQTVQKYGKIDVLVSNAAANPTTDDILQMQESVLDKIWEINVKTAILIIKEAAAHFSTGSSVVFVSSIAGYRPERPLGMYDVTKTALLGLTKALAMEMAPDTRVNCVAPGTVATRFASFITRNDAVKDEIVGKTLLKRLGTTEDMGAAVAFLASDDASYITGETIVVAGGIPSRL